MGASPDVPHVREDRLLRQLAEPAREPALPRGRPSARALGRAGRGLVVVLRGRGDARPEPGLRRLALATRLARRTPVRHAIRVALPLRADGRAAAPAGPADAAV